MKLTKLFSHSCDEGGLVTRNYVKVFTDSTVKDLKTYYRYLYQNKMYSQLNNFTDAMRMFGLFQGIKDRFKNSALGKTIDAIGYGLRSKKYLDAADDVLKDRQSGKVDTSAYAHMPAGYTVSDADRALAYDELYDPRIEFQLASEDYANGNRGLGASKEAFKGISSKDQLMDENRQAMNDYLTGINEERGIAADKAQKEAMIQKAIANRWSKEKMAAMGLIPQSEPKQLPPVTTTAQPQPAQKRRKLVVVRNPNKPLNNKSVPQTGKTGKHVEFKLN